MGVHILQYGTVPFVSFTQAMEINNYNTKNRIVKNSLRGLFFKQSVGVAQSLSQAFAVLYRKGGCKYEKQKQHN